MLLVRNISACSWILLALASFPSNGAKSRVPSTDPGPVGPVPLCEALSGQSQYNGEPFLLTATYRVSYEASELYCLSCASKQVWVEMDSAEDGDKSLRRLNRLLRNSNGTVNGVFFGSLYSKGTYGHLGAYRYMLLLKRASNLKLVDRVGLPPQSLDQTSGSRVCK
jgi:hypothetical protein